MKTPVNLVERDAAVLAQGHTGTNSKRWTQYVYPVMPTHAIGGQGPYLIASDGKKYLDFVSGLGTNILGYNHPAVTDAVIKQASRGASFSLPHILEGEVADLIRELVPAAEKVRFLKTGNEATLAAARIAGMHGQGIRVEGYHGHGDLWTSLTRPALGVNDSFDCFPYEHGEWEGNIIIEPIMIDASEERRAWVSSIKTNCVLIFDEIVTGFRVPKYTVASWWGIQPDIICLGKALANGYPLAVVAGKKEVMDCGEYFVSSTYSGEAISLAACKATLTELRKKNIDDLYYYALRFMNRLNGVLKPLECSIQGYGTRGMFGPFHEKSAMLMQECSKAGILLGKAYFYGFAHFEANIEEFTLNVMSDAVNRIQQGRVKLEGSIPQQTFKR